MFITARKDRQKFKCERKGCKTFQRFMIIATDGKKYCNVCFMKYRKQEKQNDFNRRCAK